MVIMKPPRIGGQVNWHQDGTFLIDAQQRCMGIWFALEDAGKVNGCLQFGGPPQGLCNLFEMIRERRNSDASIDRCITRT